MPKKISKSNSDETIFDVSHSDCYSCEVFNSETDNLNIDKDELYRRRDKCANCRKTNKGEYKYDCIKKLENSIKKPRWKLGKSLTYDERTVIQIAELKKEGLKQKEIAHMLGLSEATISRFLKGNYSKRTNEQIKKTIANCETQ